MEERIENEIEIDDRNVMTHTHTHTKGGQKTREGKRRGDDLWLLLGRSCSRVFCVLYTSVSSLFSLM